MLLQFLRPTWFDGRDYAPGDQVRVEEPVVARILMLRGDAQRVTDADGTDRTLPSAPSVEHRDPSLARRGRK